MSDFQFGAKPYDFTVRLARNADFDQTIRTKDGEDFGAGPLQLRFADAATTVWTATITDDQAVWAEDKADVDTLIAAIGTKRKVRLFYGDLNWANGTVNIDG